MNGAPEHPRSRAVEPHPDASPGKSGSCRLWGRLPEGWPGHFLMQKSARLLTVLFASSFFVLTGCHQTQQNGVVATVNGHPILQADMDKVYDAQVASNPHAQTMSTDQSDALKLNILHELIVEEIVEQRAQKLGLTATDAEVDAKLQEMKAPFTEEQFQARLKAGNLTIDDVRRDLRRSLTQTKLLNKEINSKITV